MWAVVPFAAGLLMLGAFIGFVSWERRRGLKVYAEFRERADRRISKLYRMFVLGQVPIEWRHAFLTVMHLSVHRIVVLLVETLRAIERPLTRLSHYLRTRSPSANGKEVSSFLKSIVPGKRPSRDDGSRTEGDV